MSQPPFNSSGSDSQDPPRPSFGQPGPAAEPSSGAGGSSAAAGSGSTNPFGPAAPGVPSGRPGPTGEPARPGGKKRRNVGLILTIIGVILLLGSVALGIGGVVTGAKAISPAMSAASASEPNGSDVTGGTSEAVVKVDKMGVVFPLIAEADAANATCTVTGGDGVTVTSPGGAAANGDVEMVIDGTQYTAADTGWLVEGSGEATVSCSDVTAPVHAVGPISFSGTLGSLGLFIGAVAVGLLGLLLVVAGIIVMIVRASRNRRTV